MRGLSSWGRENIRWKAPVGSSSAFCFSTHWALVRDWHLGQWRFLQVIRGVLVATGFALIYVAAELRRATVFNRPHDLAVL